MSSEDQRQRVVAWAASCDSYQRSQRNPAVCWFDMCQEAKLPGMMFCAQHEILYRADHDNVPSHEAASLAVLGQWERQYV